GVFGGRASRTPARGWGPAGGGGPMEGSASRRPSRGWGPAGGGEPMEGSASRRPSRGWGPAGGGEPMEGSASRRPSRGWGPAGGGEPTEDRGGIYERWEDHGSEPDGLSAEGGQEAAGAASVDARGQDGLSGRLPLRRLRRLPQADAGVVRRAHAG